MTPRPAGPEEESVATAPESPTVPAILDQQKAGGGAPTGALAIKDIQRPATWAQGGGKAGKATKGGGKAANGGGKPAVPAGAAPDRAHRKDPTENKPLCYAFSRKEKCVQEPCAFGHVCWWCLDPSHAGNDCPN